MLEKHREEVSAGGVVYRKTPDRVEFLIGEHSGYHKWVLPKGLVEEGETEQDAAVREVEEEVGVQARIVGGTPVKIIEYWYTADFGTQKGAAATGQESERRVKKYQESGGGTTKVHKKVLFYLMELVHDLGKEGWEMSDRNWVTYEEGLKLLAFETEREVFTEAVKLCGASGQNPA